MGRVIDIVSTKKDSSNFKVRDFKNNYLDFFEQFNLTVSCIEELRKTGTIHEDIVTLRLAKSYSLSTIKELETYLKNIYLKNKN